MTESLLAAQTEQPIVDQNKNYLTELVGDGKKFKSPEDLAKGKFESDQFIETLKRQQDQLRADYLKLKEEADAKASLETLIRQVEAQKSPTQTNHIQPPVNDVKPSLDPQQIESLVSNKLVQFETQKKQTDNFNAVQAKLKERLGDNYQGTLKKQIDELGLTSEYVDNLAKTSPTAFYRQFGLETVQQETFQAPPNSSVRTTEFKPRGQEKRTWSWYQDLKLKNPKAYYDPKTNVQMHNDMISLGETFKDGDFKMYGD